MAGKSYHYGKKYKKRSSAFKKQYPNVALAMSIAKKALYATKYITGMINCEKKKIDYELYDAQATSNSNNPALITQIGQGDDDNSRQGNSVLCRGLLIQWRATNNTTSPRAFSAVRIMIIQDTQQVADASTLTLADVLENTGANDIIESPLNSTTVGRFKILYNRVIQLDTVAHPQQFGKHFIPMKHHIRWNGTAASDVQKGAIYALIVCDNAASATTNPLVTFNSRMYYYDN